MRVEEAFKKMDIFGFLVMKGTKSLECYPLWMAVRLNWK